MMMDYITLAGFILAVFGTGVAVGKIVEKARKKMKNIKTHAKTTAISILQDRAIVFR